MKQWEESSWRRGKPASLSKLEISFLLNPQTGTGTQEKEDSSTTTTPGIADESIEEAEDINAIENETPRTMSAFETIFCTTLGSGLSISNEWMSFERGDESPHHEIGNTDKTFADGTRHVSLISGDLIKHGAAATTREGSELQRRSLQSNLKEPRVSLASGAKSPDFQRRVCCKRMRCFERLDQHMLRKCEREILLMGPIERRARLQSWLIDGVYVFDGKRVCSVFLARAFRFSKELQRAVRICNVGC